MTKTPNSYCAQETPVCAFLFIQAQVSGASDADR
jgi:hypothetical protein